MRLPIPPSGQWGITFPNLSGMGTEAQFYRKPSVCQLRRNTSSANLDPYLQREKERYSHALPSREFILQILKEQGIPVNEKALHDLLQITEEENQIFDRRLSAMLREGQIMRNRKGDICVVEKLDLIKGKVQGHRRRLRLPDPG